MEEELTRQLQQRLFQTSVISEQESGMEFVILRNRFKTLRIPIQSEFNNGGGVGRLV